MNKKLLFLLPLLIFFSGACEKEEYDFLQESQRLTITTADFAYTLYDKAAVEYNKRSAFAVTKIYTDATSINVSFYSPLAALNNAFIMDAAISIYDKDWVFVCSILPDKTSDLQIKNVVLNGEGLRDFYLVEGGNSQYGAEDFEGTYIQEIEAINGILEVREIPKSANRIVSIGDSISIGDGSSLNTRYGWGIILRGLLRSKDWSLTTDGWGAAYTSEIIGDANSQQEMADRAVAEFSGATGRKIIIWTLGTNDFGYVVGDPAVVASYTASVWDKAYAADSGIEVILITPLWRGNQNKANSGGWILQDYRDALTVEANLRSFVTVHDGESLLSLADFTSGYLHPNDAGHDKIAKFIYNSL